MGVDPDIHDGWVCIPIAARAPCRLCATGFKSFPRRGCDAFYRGGDEDRRLSKRTKKMDPSLYETHRESKGLLTENNPLDYESVPTTVKVSDRVRRIRHFHSKEGDSRSLLALLPLYNVDILLPYYSQLANNVKPTQTSVPRVHTVIPLYILYRRVSRVSRNQ